MAALASQIDLPPMTGPQVSILRIDERSETFWDVEGSPRAAKSWGVGFLIWKLAYQYPGIAIFYARYREKHLSQLREVWGKVSAYFPQALQPVWNAQDQCYDFPNGAVGPSGVFSGSRVFLSGIKPSDTDGLHSKYKGKTLAVIIIEEAQELPYANYVGLKERLSQSRTPAGEPFAYPLKLILVHNCIDEDHWIAKEFPLDSNGACLKAGHAHIRADLYSNRQNLGEAVMDLYERSYPVGHPLRATVIEGRRGLSLVGTPVYAGYFDRQIHVLEPGEAIVNPHYPLLEGWDFGHEKPAVTWWQYHAHSGAVVCLGAVRGNQMFLETFAPAVLAVRARWFPQATTVHSWCDPAGATSNFGTTRTAMRMLQDLGIPARPPENANSPDVRYAAIQVLAGMMERVTSDGSPCFQVVNRCIEVSKTGATVTESASDLLLKAFEAGYIWDEHAPSDAHPNIRKPKKGTRYDDLMNAAEYVVTGEGWSVPSQAQLLRATERMKLLAERDGVRRHQQRLADASVGPTGESLMAAFARVGKEAKGYRDRDPLDRRVRRGSNRGGW